MLKHKNTVCTLENLQKIIDNINVDYFKYVVTLKAGADETYANYVSMPGFGKLAYIEVTLTIGWKQHYTSRYPISLNFCEDTIYACVANAIGQAISDEIKRKMLNNNELVFQEIQGYEPIMMTDEENTNAISVI